VYSPSKENYIPEIMDKLSSSGNASAVKAQSKKADEIKLESKPESKPVSL
jgi:hypothetical protein